MTHTIKDYLLVEVPEDAFSFRIDGNGIEPLLSALLGELTSNNAWNKIWNHHLPPGSYSIVAVSDEIGEEVAKEIVKPVGYTPSGKPIYDDYSRGGLWHYTALDSFRSWLTSLSIGRAVIVKKLK